MMAEVLFFDDFSKKDLHLNAVEMSLLKFKCNLLHLE